MVSKVSSRILYFEEKAEGMIERFRYLKDLFWASLRQFFYSRDAFPFPARCVLGNANLVTIFVLAL